MSYNLVDPTTGDLTLVAGGTLWADNPIGSILPYGGTSAPSGWFLCQGQVLSRTTYSELFAVIGTSFGSGDGSTTFNLPDMRESVPKGAGETGKTVGAHVKSGGLAVGEFIDDRVQTHMHNVQDVHQSGSTIGWGAQNSNTLNAYTSTSSNTGRSGATTEVKSVGTNYIIKAKMCAMPSDFMSKVDEAVEEANTPISTEITIDSTSGTFLKLTKVGNMVFGQISATASNNLTITDSQILASIPEAYRTTNEVRFYVSSRISGQYAIFRYFSNGSQLQVDTKGIGVLHVPVANFSYVID